MILSLPTLLLSLSLASSSTHARPAFFNSSPKVKRVAQAEPSPSLWVATGPNLYLPGGAIEISATTSSTSSSSSRTPTATATEGPHGPWTFVSDQPTPVPLRQKQKRSNCPVTTTVTTTLTTTLMCEETTLSYVTPQPTPVTLLNNVKRDDTSDDDGCEDDDGDDSSTTFSGAAPLKAVVTNVVTVTAVKTVVLTATKTATATVTAGGAALVTATSSKTTTTAAKTTSTPATTTAATTAPQSTGLTGALYWNMKTTFGSLASFQQNVGFVKWAWGAANAAVLQAIPGVSGAQSVLQVKYPAGSYNPSDTPVGGVGFYANPLDITSATNVSFAFSVYFPTGFNFVMGGKLPGLYGGTTGCSGGDLAENCFSTRFMFRTGGMGELYLYAPREKQTTATCTLKPLSYCNTVDGMSLGRGSWYWKTGVWNNVRQDIWLNTPGVADGGFNIWVNDVLVLTADTVYYRNLPTTLISGNTTTSPPLTLIDYDNLPSNITIPNGGFNVTPIAGSTVPPTNDGSSDDSSTFSLTSLPTKLVSIPIEPTATSLPGLGLIAPTPTGTDSGSIVPGSDYGNRKKRNVVNLEERASAALPIGFLGIMFDTFFGGSTTAWASPKLQYSYFAQLALRIRS